MLRKFKNFTFRRALRESRRGKLNAIRSRQHSATFSVGHTRSV